MKKIILYIVAFLLLTGCSENTASISLQDSSAPSSTEASESSSENQSADSPVESADSVLLEDEIMEQVRNGTFLVEGIPLSEKENEPDELESWLGDYSYTEMWGGALPSNFNRGVEHTLSIFKDGGNYYASLSQSGWMTDFANRAIVLGNQNQIDIYCLYGEEGHMSSPYDSGELLLSFHWDNQELLTTYHGYTVNRAKENQCIRSFTRNGAPSPYEETSGFINEINYIKQDGKWGHIHADGKVVEPQYDDIYWYITDHAMAQVGNQYTVLDTLGNQIYELGTCTVFNQGKPIELSDFDFSTDLVLFELDGQYGLISGFHWVILLPELDFVYEFNGEYAIAKGKNGLYGIVDYLGMAVVPLEYDSVDAPEIASYL